MKDKSIIQNLLRNILIIIIILTALILFQQKIYNDFISDSISQQYLSEITSRAEDQFKGFYTPIISNLNLSQKYGRSGLLTFQNTKEMNNRFIPILEELPQIHSVKFVNGDQHIYTLTRGDSQWVSGLIVNINDPNRIRLQYWSYGGKLLKQEWTTIEYNTFQQPWYLDAMDSSKTNIPRWTKPRFIVSAQSLGITVSVKWTDTHNDNHLNVLAFDVLLKDIYQSISNLKVGENSRVFLFRSDGTVFKLRSSDTLSSSLTYSEQDFVDPRQLNSPSIMNAINQWEEEGRPIDEPLDFTINQTSFWIGVRPIDRDHADLWIGILIPENDILHELQRRQMTNISISVSLLLLGILIVIIMVKKYRKRLSREQLIALEGDELEIKIRGLIDKGENKVVEFKSTMRMNLKTNQPGKEIEIAWLKTANAFLNSEGGVLFFGVNDDGEFIGIEADNFENEDKCRLHFKNLINQHIGAEFTSYLNFRVLKIENKTIAFLECTPSQKPVFLKDKNEEHFYIRSGPSSIKLQTSKVLEYIEGREI